MKELDELFKRLWDTYAHLNPQAGEIHSLLGDVENDHIALRTFNNPKTNLEKLAKVFTNLGYVEKGQYKFEEKKLVAKHYEKDGFPKVFISEIQLEEFSQTLQNIVSKCLYKFSVDNMVDVLGYDLPWEPISYQEYLKVKEESEYAAWLCSFGFIANHFTVNVNKLKKYENISELNFFLLEKGFILNENGGAVKGSKEKGLMQSSTMASEIKMYFSDGPQMIPCCYYEFAERFNDFEGFIASSADKIFESTDNKL